MAILNYSTKISAEKTASEIQAILGRFGAQAVMMEFSEGVVSAISFRLELNATLLSFRLPINSDGVQNVLKRNKDARSCFKTKEQSVRVAWRIIKVWVDAQLALVEASQAELAEVFLPYLQDATGTTIYSKLKSGGFRALEHN